MIFYTNIHLPVSKQNVQVREMNMQEYTVLQKHLLESNDADAALNMMSLAQLCCKQDIKHLCNMDAFYILCKIRTMSLGDELHFVFNEVSIRCSLEDCIQKMQSMDFNCKKVLVVNGMPIELNLPQMLNIKDYADVLEGVIAKVGSIELHSLSAADRLRVLNSLPATVMEQCIEFTKQGFATMQHHWFIQPNDAVDTPGIELNAFNNSLMEILKFIFKDDLMNTYNLKYILASKLNITPAQADALSPVECRIYVSLLNDEVSKQNKQLQDQNNATKYNL